MSKIISPMAETDEAAPHPATVQRVPRIEETVARQDHGAGRQDKDQLSPWRRYTIAVVLLIVLLLIGYLLWHLLASDDSVGQSQQRPPVTVAATYATSETWYTQLPAVGTLEAVQGVEVTTEMAGIVEEIAFTSGQQVERGELLVQLRAQTDYARLERLREQLEQARADLARNRRLRQSGVIAEATFEEFQTAVETLEAEVEEQREIIDKKSITAPFSGELGIRQVDLGEFVAAGQPVVLLQTIEPIYLNFYLPEQYYQTIAASMAGEQTSSLISTVEARGLPVEVQVDAYPERTFTGRISAVSPQVSIETRNFLVQATLPNEEGLLRPGMFAEVTVIVPDQREVTVLPATAISYNPYGNAVFLIQSPTPQQQHPNRNQEAANPQDGWFAGLVTSVQGWFGGGSGTDNPGEGQTAEQGQGQQTIYMAERAFVTTGERRDAKIEIIEGVDPGDRVVTAGQLKLEDGAPVVISPEAVGPDGASNTAKTEGQ